MLLLDGLRLVGWPLLLGSVIEIAAKRRRERPEATMPLAAASPEPVTQRKFLPIEIARTVCVTVLAISFGAVLLYAVLALLWAGIDDGVGQSIAAISGGWARGQPIYPDAATIGRYGVFPYGPLLFQIVGLSIKLLGPYVLAAKVPSVLAFIGSTIGLYWVLRRHEVGVATSLMLVQMLVVVEGTLCIWVRPDPFLIAIVVLACYVSSVSALRGWRGVVILSILAGLATALKFPGVFYVIPALFQMTTINKVGDIILFSVLALIVSFLPFLLPGTSLENYVYVLKTASHDGVYVGIFISNICFMLNFVLATHALSPGMHGAPYYRSIGAVMAAGVAVSIFAAKAGAGPHHLIPFLPYLAVLLGDVLSNRAAPIAGAASERRQKAQLFLFAAMLVAFQPISGAAHALRLMYAAPAAASVVDGLR